MHGVGGLGFAVCVPVVNSFRVCASGLVTDLAA